MQNQFLKNYIEIVEGDLDKMIQVAVDAEKRYKTVNGGPTPISPPSTTPNLPDNQSVVETSPIITTTEMPLSNHVNTPVTLPNPKYARCAIPIAMTLTSSLEFIGCLLHQNNMWANNSRFNDVASTFFEYAGVEINVTLFRDIFRNGYMHIFFPQGNQVAINFDSSFKDKPLLFKYEDKLELNVYKLNEIVRGVFRKIIHDTTKVDIINMQIDNYRDFICTSKKQKYINEFLENNNESPD